MPRQSNVNKSTTAIAVAKAEGIDITGGKAAQGRQSVDLSSITSAAEELRGIYSKMAEMDVIYQHLQDRVIELETSILPDRMTEAGMATFTLTTGEQVIISDIVRGSIPSLSSIESEKDPIEKEAKINRRREAFAFLKRAKAEDLIKTEVAASFGKGEYHKAIALFKSISKQGIPALLEQAVHPQTLNKWLRESISAGKEIPEEPFQLFTGKQAKIAAVKQKATIVNGKAWK